MTKFNSTSSTFDPFEKEALLRSESQSWDTSRVHQAYPDDIPLIDLSEYFETQSQNSLEVVASQLRKACLEVGFYSMVGHQFPESLLNQTYVEARKFLDLSLAEKNELLMDREGWPIKGVGYLPFKNRKLPTRDKGNLNEAFVLKSDHVTALSDNQWPNAERLAGFREKIECYAEQVQKLAIRLLPVYARALRLDKDFFAPAFTSPLYRLRLTRYGVVSGKEADEFGIAPHVDTSFFTLLAQNSPGLVIYSESRKCWIQVPVIKNSFIVNTGELLKQWSNDQFISVKHFANNNTDAEPRYSIPFFFNANADYPMQCLPSCCSDNNPPRYPTITYLQSQGVVQGE